MKLLTPKLSGNGIELGASLIPHCKDLGSIMAKHSCLNVRQSYLWLWTQWGPVDRKLPAFQIPLQANWKAHGVKKGRETTHTKAGTRDGQPASQTMQTKLGP